MALEALHNFLRYLSPEDAARITALPEAEQEAGAAVMADEMMADGRIPPWPNISEFLVHKDGIVINAVGFTPGTESG